MNLSKKPTSAEFQQRYNNRGRHRLSALHTVTLHTFNENNLCCFFVFSFVRVELHKRKLLEQCDLEQEMIYEELRQKKVAQDQTMERVKAQLLVRMFSCLLCFSTS